MAARFADCIAYNPEIKGRLGGCPPLIIEDEIPQGYGFYITFVHPDKPEKMLSVITPKDFDERIDHSIYPDMATRVIEHNFSEMGNRKDLRLEEIGEAILSVSEYRSKGEEDDFTFIQVGGEPFFIQNKLFYWEKIERDDYSFFVVINEEGYLDCEEDEGNIKQYVFAYGALYLYKHNQTGEIRAGFWQYS